MPVTRLNAHQERVAAVNAGCDPRTIRAYLQGKPTRSTTAARIAGALREMGIDASPQPADGPTPQPEAGRK